METGIGKEAREEGIPCSDENQKMLVTFVNLYDNANADCNSWVVSFRYLIKKPLCINHEATPTSTPVLIKCEQINLHAGICFEVCKFFYTTLCWYR